MAASFDFWIGSSVLSGICMFVAMVAYRRDRHTSQRAIKQRNDTIAELARNAGTLHAAVKEQMRQREEAERACTDATLRLARLTAAEQERERLTAEHHELRRRVDDTERRLGETEDARREVEARLRLLGGATDVIAFTIDREGRWTYLSSAWESLTGRAVGATLGCPAVDDVSVEDRPAWLEFQRSLVAREHDSGTGMVRLAGDDGAPHWLEVRIQPVYDHGGEVVALGGTFVDVTTRVQLERALHRQQALSRLLADDASDVVLVVGEQGRITYVSPSALPRLGYAPRELIALDPRSIVDDAHRARVDEAIGRVCEGQTARECVRVRHGDGRWLWLDLDASRVTDPGTGTTSYRVRGRDITALRESQEALAALRANLSAAPAVARRTEPGVEGRVDLDALLGECVADRAAADRPVVSWRLELDADGARVAGDRERVGRAVRMLLLHVQRAVETVAAPVITVRTIVLGSEVLLSITDNATSSAADLLRVWDPFAAVDPGASGSAASVVHEAVRAVGGRLDARSLVGVGTTLTVGFRAAEPEVAARAESAVRDA